MNCVPHLSGQFVRIHVQHARFSTRGRTRHNLHRPLRTGYGLVFPRNSFCLKRCESQPADSSELETVRRARRDTGAHRKTARAEGRIVQCKLASAVASRVQNCTHHLQCSTSLARLLVPVKGFVLPKLVPAFGARVRLVACQRTEQAGVLG